MKNSKEYSKKITSLHSSLKRKYSKVQNVTHKHVVDAIIYGIICEKFSVKDTDSAIKKFNDYFVDMNDLRVSRLEEIAEILGEDTPGNRQIALTITKVLQRIFNENHQISLEALHKMGKRPARQKLEEMEELSRFVVDYCMLTSLQGHAIPLTEKMIEYLKRNELVDEGADEQTIAGFLAKQISAKKGYEFYALLRHDSETQKIKKKVKAQNKKTSKKVEKKTKTKKKTITKKTKKKKKAK